MRKAYLIFKRIADFLLALLGLVLLFPLLLTIVIAIKLDSRGPIFFRQTRIGIHKTHFDIYKFRTMCIGTPRDTPTHLLKNPGQWITRIGCFLRKYSLDELPQILNILRGDMSVVGPRPALWNQFDLIEEREKYGANDVPVGLTGWAQINGRDHLSIPDKARLDGEYAQRFGLLTDIRCFFGTFTYVVRCRGVLEGGPGAKGKKSSEENSGQGKTQS